MSYLEEWDRIEQMIENHNVSKSTIVPPEKRQALALSHIAKCLSVIADDIVGDCKECKEATEDKPCSNCIHSNDEHELNCGVCDEWHSEYKPFGFRSEKKEIEVRCPSCGEIITVIRTSDKLLNLKCPTCNIDFTYNISTNVREWRI